MADSTLLDEEDPDQAGMMDEMCILVDIDDNPIGSASKLDCHRGAGLRHRAFSVLIFDSNNRLLLQKRASDKITFPGVWANSCCSHPLDIDGEKETENASGVKNAAVRKMEQELGIPTGTIPADNLLYVTRMEYMARMNEVWVEHEIDHIMVVRADVEVSPNPNEIEDTRWVSKIELEEMASEHEAGNLVIAPWFDLIRVNLLDNWWDDIDEMSNHIDGKIHRFMEERPDRAGLSIMDKHRVAAEKCIARAIEKSTEPRLGGAMMHLIEGGGKRLRAVLPSLVGEAVGTHHKGHHDLGAAIEIIHNFTLVHDDIMDNDPIRRGRPAVHIAYDMPTAINAGDAMLALAFEMIAESADIKDEVMRDLVRVIGRMVRKVSEGQQMDMDFENRSDGVSEAEYITMISGKTAAMFETCAQTGAMLAGASEEIQETCRLWGLETGLCFQLMDDLIDITGDTVTLGKPAGSDVLEGKRTLMAIHALNQDPSNLPTFHSIFGKGESGSTNLPKAIAEMQAVGSLEYGRKRAMEHHSEAHRHLSKLDDSNAKSVLEGLTDWQLERMS